MAKDFRNKQFGRILRGYNPEEVDEYLAYITEEYRKLERRCANSERQRDIALKALDEMHQKTTQADHSAGSEVVEAAKAEAERITAEAAQSASAAAEEARRTAQADARKVLEQAAQGAEQILADAENAAHDNREKADALYRSAQTMYREVCSFRDSLFDLYNAHLESMEQIAVEANRTMTVVHDAYCPEDGGDNPAVQQDDPIVDEDEAAAVTEEAGDEAESGAYEEAEESGAEDDEAAEEEGGMIDLLVDPFEDLDDFEAREEESEEDSSEEAYDMPAEQSDDEAAEDSGDEDSYDEFTLDEDDAFRIDWSGGRTGEAEAEEDEAEDEETAEDDEEPADESAFGDLDGMFTEAEAEDLSLTDEFDLVFNGANARKSVEEIRKQPIVAPEKPKKPKKHQKF